MDQVVCIIGSFCFRNGEGGAITAVAGVALPIGFLWFIVFFIFCCCTCCCGCDDEDDKEVSHISQIKHAGVKIFVTYNIS